LIQSLLKISFAILFDAFQPVFFVFGEPAKDPDQVAIDRDFLLVEGNGTDGAGSVFAHARQRKKIFLGGRDFALKGFDDFEGGFMKVSPPGVIAEPFPEFEDVFFAPLGEILNARELLQEAEIIGSYGVDLSLLKHDLRKVDVIRGGVFPPRHMPAVGLIPNEKIMFEGHGKSIKLFFKKGGSML
jgi:hypothetical protein